jgi:alpha-ketoglutarate-dependent taurine dioxygenase
VIEEHQKTLDLILKVRKLVGVKSLMEPFTDTLIASHPAVRTNPVTGWKSLFGAAHQVEAGWIDNVTPRENNIIKDYFLQLNAKNHDLQVRFKWRKNDLAIWDNRSAFHTATNDYSGKRQGNRVVSLGERSFYDPNSVSRRQALGLL